MAALMQVYIESDDDNGDETVVVTTVKSMAAGEFTADSVLLGVEVKESKDLNYSSKDTQTTVDRRVNASTATEAGIELLFSQLLVFYQDLNYPVISVWRQ